MATKLDVYNDALRRLGDLRLASLTEDVEARYVLDGAWAQVVEMSLTDAYWNFATKTVALEADDPPDGIPGFYYSFTKPADWLRTVKAYPDERKMVELDYADESGKLYAGQESMILRYVSKAPAATPESWPAMFADVVAARLALETCERLTQNSGKFDTLYKLHKEALATAKSRDALDQSGIRLRSGSWVRSMRGGYSKRTTEIVRGVQVNSIDGGSES